MTPEKQFLLFASNHTEDYVKGWLDGMSECIEMLKNISEVEHKNSTSDIKN